MKTPLTLDQARNLALRLLGPKDKDENVEEVAAWLLSAPWRDLSKELPPLPEKEIADVIIFQREDGDPFIHMSHKSLGSHAHPDRSWGAFWLNVFADSRKPWEQS